MNLGKNLRDDLANRVNERLLQGNYYAGIRDFTGSDIIGVQVEYRDGRGDWVSESTWPTMSITLNVGGTHLDLDEFEVSWLMSRLLSATLGLSGEE